MASDHAEEFAHSLGAAPAFEAAFSREWIRRMLSVSEEDSRRLLLALIQRMMHEDSRVINVRPSIQYARNPEAFEKAMQELISYEFVDVVENKPTLKLVLNRAMVNLNRPAELN